MFKFNGLLCTFLALYISEFILWALLERLNCAHLKRHGQQTASRFKGFVDGGKLSRINAYTQGRSRTALLQKLTSDLLLLVLILVGFLAFLDRQCTALGLPMVWAGLLFFGILGFIFYAVDLPFDYYHTFVIEENFGFNRSNLKLWLADHLKAALLSALLFCVILGLTLWAIQAYPNTWWLWGVALMSGFQVVLVLFYPIVIAPLFNRFEPLHDEDLADKVRDLLKQAAVGIKGIFQMDAGRRSRHTNAYFAGMGKSKRVVLFDTLLQRHPQEEVLAVLAHEAGHYVGKHLLKYWVIFSASMFLVFYLTYLLMAWPELYATFGLPESEPYVGLLLVGIFWQKAGFFLKPIFMAFTRRWENEADRFTVHLQDDPEPLIKALKRMAADNLTNLAPHPMYVWFNATHPPIAQRVALVEANHVKQSHTQR
jgi:STE24 endopeptidase